MTMVEQLPFVDTDAFVSLCIRIVFSLWGLTMSAVDVNQPGLKALLLASWSSGIQVDEVKPATRKK